jgi:hypothetical protein
LDARLARAASEVDIPADLRERILGRLAEQEVGVRGQGLGVGEAEAGEADVPRSWRRRWVYPFAAVAAGLVVLVGGYAFWPRHTALTYNSLLARSSEWFEQLRANSAWQPLAPHEAIRDFPLAAAIRPRPWHWADVSLLVGQSACAYDLTAPGGARATLFVIADDGQIAGSLLPLKPDSSTGGLMIGCWQTGELVYVLVVEGNEWTYRNLLDDSGPPLARDGLIFRPLEVDIARQLQLDEARSGRRQEEAGSGRLDGKFGAVAG